MNPVTRFTEAWRKANRKAKHWNAKRKALRAKRKKWKKRRGSLVLERKRAYRAFTEARADLDRELARPHPNQVRVHNLREKLMRRHAEFDEVMAKIEVVDNRLERVMTRLKNTNARLRWWVKKRTVLRKKLEAAKQKARPEYESWMANGYDDNVTDGVKAFVARGVVKYDCYVTSMRRSYVPPGGSTTSWHLSNPGKAADMGGARMSEFQRSEFERNKGKSECLELFGPVNDRCLKYGVPMSLSEGDALETLHDTHVHGAFE